MLNPIKEICSWQKAAGNLGKSYEDFLESSFQIEEALEGFEAPEKSLTINFISPKETSRDIISWMQSGSEPEFSIQDVDRLDKACDAIIFAIGSISKIGLDHHGITKALNIVNNANKAKLGAPKDSKGKLLKPVDFIGPEAELQKLLDNAKK